MGNQLKGSEFIEKDFYKDLIAQTNKAQKAVNKLVNALVGGLGKDKKSIQLINPKNLTELRKFNALVATSRKGITDLTNLQKKQADLSITEANAKKALITVEREAHRLMVQRTKESERLAKAKAREVKAT